MKAQTKKTYSSGAWYFLAPAVIVLFFVGIFPLLFAVWNSLHQFILPKVHSRGSFLGVWPLFDAPFNWFGNYLALLTDQSFREALFRTLFFLVINLPIQLALGMAIALLLHRPGNELLKKIGRVALVIPLATTFAVVGLMGRLMFNLDFGVLNYFWSLVFAHKLNWLADPNLAFVSISIMEDWQWTPFCALILFSSLTMVPLEIEEAARLETEKWWHILWKVQLPFMLPGHHRDPDFADCGYPEAVRRGLHHDSRGSRFRDGIDQCLYTTHWLSRFRSGDGFGAGGRIADHRHYSIPSLCEIRLQGDLR